MPTTQNKPAPMKLGPTFIPDRVTEARRASLQADAELRQAYADLRAATSALESAPKREEILDAQALAEGLPLPAERETDRAREHLEDAERTFNAKRRLEERRKAELFDVVAEERDHWLAAVAAIVGDRGDELAEHLEQVTASIAELEPAYRVAVYLHSSIGRPPEYALDMFERFDSTAQSVVAGTAVEQIAAGVEGARIMAAQVRQGPA